MERILSNAAKLISQSRRPGSIASYKSAWNKWTSWCVREKIDPFCAPLSTIVNNLSTLFDEDNGNQMANKICALQTATTTVHFHLRR